MTPSSDNFRKLHILLLEDNCDHAELIMECMVGRDENFAVTCCETTEDFFRSLSQKSYDALLIDFHTPQGDGLEILEKLKEFHVQTPVIFISGTDDDAIISQVLNGGAADFIVKTRSSLKTLPIVVKRNIIRRMAYRAQGDRAETKNPLLDLSVQVSQTLEESINKIRHASQKMTQGLRKGKISFSDFQEISGLQDILKKTADVLEKTKKQGKKSASRSSVKTFADPSERTKKTFVEK